MNSIFLDLSKIRNLIFDWLKNLGCCDNMSQNPKIYEPMTISPVKKKPNRNSHQRPLVKLSVDLINTYKLINQVKIKFN